jgi:hypothetical protein
MSARAEGVSVFDYIVIVLSCKIFVFGRHRPGVPAAAAGESAYVAKGRQEGENIHGEMARIVSGSE